MARDYTPYSALTLRYPMRLALHFVEKEVNRLLLDTHASTP